MHMFFIQVVMELGTAKGTGEDYLALFDRVSVLEGSSSQVGSVVQGSLSSTGQHYSVNAAEQKIIEATIQLKTKNPKLLVTVNFGHGISRGDIDIAAALGYKIGAVGSDSSTCTFLN